MAALTQYFREVAFVLGETTIYLTLEREWVRSCGVAPDVNIAVVSYLEYKKFTSLVDVVGSLYFYYSGSGDPANPSIAGLQNPDVQLGLVKLVDVQPSKWGVLAAGGPLIITEYRLSFADTREQFAWPSGGILTQGEVNKLPISPGGGLDANGNRLLTPYELAKLCVAAMGGDVSLVPLTLNDEPRPYDLEWRGNSAAEELQKLLTTVGYAMWVDIHGGLRITEIGRGNEPVIRKEQAIPALVFQGVDRRGKNAVFASCPNATLRTETISGLWNFQFVVQDGFVPTFGGDLAWKPLVDVFAANGVDPVAEVRAGLVHVREQYRNAMAGQIYRYFRLDPAMAGPAPIRAQVIEGTTLPLHQVRVRARIAVQNAADGTWSNSVDLVELTVLCVLRGEIIQTHEIIGQVSQDGVTDPSAFFQPIGPDDIEVRITREDYQQDDSGRWVPQFNMIGVRQKLGALEVIPSNEMAAIVDSPATIIVRRPDLRLLIVDGVEQNRTILEGSALGLAPRYVRSADPSKIIMARGYARCELGGKVTKITYDQKELSTKIEVNTWYLPHAEYLGPLLEGERGGAKSAKFPEQHATQPARLAAADSGQVQPAVAVQGPPLPRSEVSGLIVKILAPAAGGGKYTGVIVGGRSTAVATGGEYQPEGMTDGTQNALILNLFEDQKGSHRLPLNSYHLAKLVGGGSNGATVEIEACECDTSGDAPTIGITDTTIETADSSSGEAIDRSGVVIEKYLSRIAYNDGGDQTLYAFFRTRRIACGIVTDIGTETRVAVFTTCA